jgi:retinol dehydrogenase-14
VNGKLVLVTGATDGIGRQTAFELARLGATVLVHGRSAGRAGETAAAIRGQIGEALVEPVVADFASLEQVRGLASLVLERHPRLDVLVNNAGVYLRRRRTTVDGFEATFQVNYLAGFLLTLLLLDALRAAAPARIVTVSSAVHVRAGLDLDRLPAGGLWSSGRAYAVSKLCQVLFTVELAERLAGSGVTSNALHPGVVNTKLLRAGWFMPAGESVQRGARLSVHLATSSEVEGLTGRFFMGRRPVPPSPLASDVALRRALWEESERLVGLRPKLSSGRA